MTAEGTVAFWSDNKVGQIVFDRPPANAYDLNFHEQFNAAIQAADVDEVDGALGLVEELGLEPVLARLEGAHEDAILVEQSDEGLWNCELHGDLLKGREELAPDAYAMSNAQYGCGQDEQT